MLKYQKKKPTALLQGISLTTSAALAILTSFLPSIQTLQEINILGFFVCFFNAAGATILALLQQRSVLPHQNIALIALWILPLNSIWTNNAVAIAFFAPWAFVFVVYVALFERFKYKSIYFPTYISVLIILLADSYFVILEKNSNFALSKLTVPWTLSFIFILATILAIYVVFSNKQSRKARKLEKMLQREIEERLKTEEILLNTLPLRIILRLKKGEQVIADRFSQATILFADLVGFTEMANKVTPTQLFRMINKIFLQFDEITNKKYLQKIKTNGDSYMVAGGISPDSPSNAARASVELAIKMRKLIEELSNQTQQRLQLRVGISTGPVVAGILGSRKFIFDVWGDTVNIASRLSSEGDPQSILIDEVTYRLCQKPDWFEHPHEFWLKGKGKYLAYPVKEKLSYPHR